MRLFVAAELPPAVRAALAAAAPRDAGWRPVREENLHVTLAFLGERASEEGIPEALRDLGPAVAAELDGTVLLPPRRPRVCAVAVASDGLVALQRRVSAALAALGVYAPERRRFLPHVTVARARGRAARVEVEASARFTVSSVALFRSRPGPSGSTYIALHRTTLPG